MGSHAVPLEKFWPLEMLVLQILMAHLLLIHSIPLSWLLILNGNNGLRRRN